jgi:LEA14-like dessication related protein
MMKKTSARRLRVHGVRAVFLVCAVSALALLGTCESMPALVKEPAVSFDSVALRKIGLDGVDMVARIKVENGNPFTIPLPDIDWELLVKDASFLKGKTAGGSKIAASKASIVEIPFTAPYKGLLSTVTSLAGADEAPYTVKAGARFSSIPVLKDKRFATEFSGSLPLLKIPAISFEKVEFTSKTPAKVEFVMNWLVENKNAFALRLDKLNYDFSVNKSSWAKGEAPQKFSIPAKKTARVPITVSVSSASMIRDILAITASGKGAAYTCSGEAALLPVLGTQASPVLTEALTLPFKFSGTTN